MTDAALHPDASAPAAEPAGRVKLVLLVASSLTVLAGAVISPALPGIRAAFPDAPSGDLLVRLVLTAPALAIALGATPVGVLVDRRGRKPVLLVALLLYAAAGTSGLYLDSLVALIAGRLLLGLAVAGVMTAATTLIADLFSGVGRGRFMGKQAAFMGFGGLVFVVAGGALADLHWRAPFALYALSLLVLPGALLWVREPARGDVPVTGAGGSRPLPWLRTAPLLGAALAGMALFYVIPVQVPFALQARLDASGLLVGVALGAATLPASANSLLFSRVLVRLGHPLTLAVTFALVAAGFVVLGYAERYAVVLGAMAVCGAGLGWLMPNLSTWLAALSPQHQRGRMLGMLTMCVFLGQFLSPILMRPVVQTWGLYGLHGAFGAAAIAAASVCAAILAATALAARRDPAR